MNELEGISSLPTLEHIKRLQAEMSKYPQAELDTRHYFADGMYLRELPRKAGTLIVGKVHKKEHFYIVLSGEVTVAGEGKEAERIKAPRILVCKPGTKRAVFAHVDSICITVHRTHSTNMDEIEKELVEEDPDSMYLAGNICKPIMIEE